MVIQSAIGVDRVLGVVEEQRFLRPEVVRLMDGTCWGVADPWIVVRW